MERAISLADVNTWFMHWKIRSTMFLHPLCMVNPEKPHFLGIRKIDYRGSSTNFSSNSTKFQLYSVHLSVMKSI